MPLESDGASTIQLTLFDFQKASSGAFELFPKVWTAAEALTDQIAANRLAGLACLEEVSAARYSPLVAYLLVTKLTDHDFLVRAKLIRVLASVFAPDDQGNLAPEAVRQNLLIHLAQLQPAQVLSILEAASADPSLERAVTLLLKASCDAGSQLLDILADRKMSLKLRERAAYFIFQVGFVDAIPGIERIISRLESRINGQQAFSFSLNDSGDESQLLPTLQLALASLQAP